VDTAVPTEKFVLQFITPSLLLSFKITIAMDIVTRLRAGRPGIGIQVQVISLFSKAF
jgi:hypothetical protein